MASAAAKSSASALSAFITLLTRRGYASASVSHPSLVVSSTRLRLKKGSPDEPTKTASWAPDPVTGYYRPENHAKEIDAAELRRVLLSKK